MPLKKGSSKSTASENIREMMQAGHSQKQSVAAALDNQRKSKRSKRGSSRKSHRKSSRGGR